MHIQLFLSIASLGYECYDLLFIKGLLYFSMIEQSSLVLLEAKHEKQVIVTVPQF
jgi:hypothetical protein